MQAHQGKEVVWQGRVPKDQVDTAVILLVDLSGSMTKGKPFSRLYPYDLPIFKPFDKPLRQCTLGMGAIQYEISDGGNSDAHALRVATKIVEDNQVSRRVLIVLSDGEPATAGVDKKISHAELVEAVQEAEKHGVQCLGIGMQTISVCDFYPRHVVLHSLASLSTTVMDELDKMLTGKQIKEAI